MKLGSPVRVLDPFDAAFPGVYTVDAVSADGATATVYGDRDFDAAAKQIAV